MPLFRTRLRVLRAEREWSQAKLAAQVGVTRQTINCNGLGKTGWALCHTTGGHRFIFAAAARGEFSRSAGQERLLVAPLLKVLFSRQKLTVNFVNSLRISLSVQPNSSLVEHPFEVTKNRREVSFHE